MDTAVPLAAIGLVTIVLTVVVRPLFSLLRDNTKATAELSKSMDKVANSMASVAKETKQGNKEAKQRNGHLAELTIESKQASLEAIKSIKEN